MSSLRRFVLRASFRVGLLRLVQRMWGTDALTVLAYHRIAEISSTTFDMFAPNVSATPSRFAEQMDFVARHFNVVSVTDVQNWLMEKRQLPSNPLLITFDDGYRDNFDHAFPILQQHGFPAVIFLATNYIGKSTPFFWDLVAYCFFHTKKKKAVFPILGIQQWADTKEKTAVMYNWLNCLKQLPDDEKETAVAELPNLLEVSIPSNAFANLCVTWDQVRIMSDAGIVFGAHTQNHPILTRISLERSQKEIMNSQAHIVAETRQPVISFAYPNGQESDFNSALKKILQQAGFSMAFTLLPGPSKPNETSSGPFAIRRIFIGHQDDLSRFAAKVAGLPRFIASLR